MLQVRAMLVVMGLVEIFLAVSIFMVVAGLLTALFVGQLAKGSES